MGAIDTVMYQSQIAGYAILVHVRWVNTEEHATKVETVRHSSVGSAGTNSVVQYDFSLFHIVCSISSEISSYLVDKFFIFSVYLVYI